MASPSVPQLLAEVVRNPDLEQALRDNPTKAISEFAGSPLQTDPWIYRIVVTSLGLVVVLAVLGGIILGRTQTPVPEVLLALGSGAIGALAGLLAPSPRAE